MTDIDKLEATALEQRAKIVAALNLTPLVPPNADTETLNVVGDAWAALTDLNAAVRELAAHAREAQYEYGQMWNRREAAEAERDRLRVALREIAALDPTYTGERPVWFEVKDALRHAQKAARAALAEPAHREANA